jgi:hypothetical protein
MGRPFLDAILILAAEGHVAKLQRAKVEEWKECESAILYHPLWF